MDTPASYRDVGLPSGHVSPKLAYHVPAATIIAYTRPKDSQLPEKRLSVRGIDDDQYMPVGDFPPEVSISSFALASTLPLLYFTTEIWSVENGTPGGNWEALYRYTLDSHELLRIACRGELTAPNYKDVPWISKLLTVGDDPQFLYCVAALGIRDDAGGYFLAELALTKNEFRPLSRLRAVFA